MEMKFCTSLKIYSRVFAGDTFLVSEQKIFRTDEIILSANKIFVVSEQNEFSEEKNSARNKIRFQIVFSGFENSESFFLSNSHCFRFRSLFALRFKMQGGSFLITNKLKN